MNDLPQSAAELVDDRKIVVIRVEADIVSARQAGREVAGRFSFGNADLALIATAISELARNILHYAGTGELEIGTITSGRRTGVLVVARDKGPGIADLERALQDGFSTGNGLGLGLPGTRRIMDEFEIDSKPGAGTTVRVAKWAPANVR